MERIFTEYEKLACKHKHIFITPENIVFLAFQNITLLA